MAHKQTAAGKRQSGGFPLFRKARERTENRGARRANAAARRRAVPSVRPAPMPPPRVPPPAWGTPFPFGRPVPMPHPLLRPPFAQGPRTGPTITHPSMEYIPPPGVAQDRYLRPLRPEVANFPASRRPHVKGRVVDSACFVTIGERLSIEDSAQTDKSSSQEAYPLYGDI